MTGAALAEALIARGMDPGEQAAKQCLFDVVLTSLNASVPSSDRRPIAAWWVPGRLEVFGTHTDYAGGHTLVCAVPRGFAVVARRRTDSEIRVVDARRQQDLSLPAGEKGLAQAESLLGWRRYVAVVARRLARNFPGAALGADIVLGSDLPRASGMSSSSALMVAVATALAHCGSLRTREEWRRNIENAADEAGYYACVENGSSFGSLEGDSGVGTHGGSEDHAAILTATANHLSPFTFVPMRALDVVGVPSSWRFVLTASGVPAQKAGTAREAYNRLADSAHVLLGLWNAESAAHANSLRDALRISGAEVLDSSRIDRLRQLIMRAGVDKSSNEALLARLEHFVREDARTLEAVDAIRSSDADRIGQLAAESQLEAETLLGNQIPETIAFAARARALGAFAAKSFGAGFGGSIWALVDGDRAAEFARRWSAEAFIATPGPPLTELTIEG